MPFFENSKFLTAEESAELFRSNQNYHHLLLDVYRETTPAFFSSKDPTHLALQINIMRNNHILNVDEELNVKYVAGFYADMQSPTMVISSLYVNPKYRQQGIATKLLKYFQEEVCGENMILVSAVSPSNHEAINLFHSVGFTSPLPLGEPDDLGAQYVDMFWAQKKFKVWHEGRMLKAEFI